MRAPYNQNVIGMHRVLIMLYNQPVDEGTYTSTELRFLTPVCARACICMAQAQAQAQAQSHGCISWCTNVKRR